MRVIALGMGLALGGLAAGPAGAAAFFFTTGNPDGLMGAAARASGNGQSQIETADDFILTRATRLQSATFTGLIPRGVSLGDIQNVEVEFYRVFPNDSTSPPSSHVPTRANSPADVEFDGRDGADGSLSFGASLVNPDFTVGNSVVNGVNPLPNVFTGGEGPVTGQEVQVSVQFTTPVDLPTDHWFFRPEVLLTNGSFLWLSTPKPIVPPGAPFSPDLQAWIRNDALAPDWLRIGTDITQQGPFNMAFSLAGAAVPEPASWTLTILGFAAVGGALRRRRAVNCAEA